MTRNKDIHIRIPGDLLTELEAEAAELGLSRSAYILMIFKLRKKR